MARKSVIKFHHMVAFFEDGNKLIQKGENACESNHVKSLSYNSDKKTIHGYVEASMKDKAYEVEVCSNIYKRYKNVN